MLFTSSIFYSKNRCNLLLKIESRIRLKIKKTNKQTNKKQQQKNDIIYTFNLTFHIQQFNKHKEKTKKTSNQFILLSTSNDMGMYNTLCIYKFDLHTYPKGKTKKRRDRYIHIKRRFI